MVKIQSSSQAEDNEGTNMTDITTISIGRTSDFGSVEDSFYEELTVTYDSISYEYKPGMETEFNKSEEWFYRTTRPAFQELFRQAAAAAVVLPQRQHRDSADGWAKPGLGHAG